MIDSLKTIFYAGNYIPHGHCYLWQTPLLLLHITSDLLIALAYFSIPLLLFYFVYKREDIPFTKIFSLFCLFIILCGTGHLLEVWTLWHPTYWITGIEKAMTAVVSCYTAGAMASLLPQFLALKSPQELDIINQQLQAEIAEKQEVEIALRQAYEELEVRVESRTKDLQEMNSYLETEILERMSAESALYAREVRLLKQQEGFLQIVKNTNIYEGNTEEALKAITKIATTTLDVHQASIWFFNGEKTKIYCANCYNQEKNQYSQGHELKLEDYPHYFQTIKNDKIIIAVDANTNPDTQEFSTDYLQSLDICSMLDVPINHQGKVVGIICLEHSKNIRNWTVDEQNFASSLAQMTALALVSQQNKDAEAELRLVTKRLQHLLSGTPAVIFSCQLGGNYDVTFVSENIKSMIGYEAEDLINGSLDWHTLIHPEDRENVDQAYNQILEKEYVSYEYREKHKNGDYRWIYDEVRLVKNDKGEQMECVGYGVDITDRKQAEMALQQQLRREKLLNSIQERIRSSLNLNAVLNMAVEEVRKFLTVDRTVIYRFNPDWTGFVTVESVTNSELSILDKQIYDPCFGKNYLPLYEKGRIRAIDNIYASNLAECHIKFLSQFGVKANLVVPISLKDKEADNTSEISLKDVTSKTPNSISYSPEKLWGLLIAHNCQSPKEWQSSEIESLRQISVQLAIAIQQCTLFEQAKIEIAERKAAEEALQKAVVAADAANRAKSEFLAAMSHELRTPLNAILGFSQVMGRDQSLVGEHRQHLEIINRSGEHLLALINDILEMSKIEAGRSKVNEGSFNLMRLLNNLDNMFSYKAKAKQIALTFDLAEDLPEFIKTDEGKLRQVLINLLGNAIKFTEKGSVNLRVSAGGNVVKNNENMRLSFAVADTGPGIYPEEIDKLFEAFTQTELGLKSQQGTGLGLPISSKFVQLMGGEIQVNSTPGVGSVFSFDIEVNCQNQQAVAPVSTQQQVSHLAPNQPNYRILLVDDKVESRLFLVKLLSTVGFQLREAENGKVAISVWEEWQPDLILMDMQMPVMNGYEATKHIKANSQENSPVILALTASAFEEERSQILKAGCDDLVRKPFDTNVLLNKIGELLGVSYIYTETAYQIEENKKLKLNSVPQDKDTIALQMESMPVEWLREISQAAKECYDDKILLLVKQIPTELLTLAEFLTDAANNFMFDDIISLCNQALK